MLHFPDSFYGNQIFGQRAFAFRGLKRKEKKGVWVWVGGGGWRWEERNEREARIIASVLEQGANLHIRECFKKCLFNDSTQRANFRGKAPFKQQNNSYTTVNDEKLNATYPRLVVVCHRSFLPCLNHKMIIIIVAEKGAVGTLNIILM